MVGNKLEKEIISIFNRDIFSFLSINQISKILKKSYPNINLKVNDLIKEGILLKYELGKSYFCSINLDNEKAIALLTLNEAEKKEIFLKQLKKQNSKNNLFNEINEIKNKFKVYTILFYENKIIFVLDYINDKEAIKNLYNEIKNFELFFFDLNSFKDYLSYNHKNLSKFIVIYYYEKYYEILNSIKNNLIFSYKLKNLNSNNETIKKRIINKIKI